MLGITEKYNKFKESTYFAGGKFVIYSFGIYLAATFTIGCLGAVIGFPLLTFPLAMLISNPVIWVLMGIILTVAYEMVVKPLFYLAKNYINGKGASKEKESDTKTNELSKSPKQEQAVNNQENSKTPDGDSGIVPDSEPVSRNSSRKSSIASDVSEDSGLGVNSAENKQHKVVTYSTVGDGNCFFHAVFGDNSSDAYKAERAQDMRMEWHKFLSQFKSLDDPSMPAPLKEQLEKVFNMFLNKPCDLTGKSDKIKKLVKQTNKEIKNAEDDVKRLVSKAVSKLNMSYNQAIHNLKEYAEALHGLGENEYNTQYNSEFITRSFLNRPELYQAYLEAIKSQSYFIFIEEISILASLANIEINVYYKDNNNEKHEEFKPDPQMINDDQLNHIFGRGSYKLNDELWGDKRQETIYLKPGHYERAKVVEAEPSLMERVNSALQGAAAACANALSLNT